MSLEAWGDDGDPPTTWEQTAMRHDFDASRHQFRLWLQRYNKEFPNDEFEQTISKINDAMDELEEQMSGEL